MNGTYMAHVFTPRPEKPITRRIGTIDLFETWLPFMKAAVVTGKSDLQPEVLGAPLRVARDKDGNIKFSPSGKVSLRVEKSLAQEARLVMENIALQMQADASAIKMAHPKEYAALEEACQKGGAPIMVKDTADVVTAQAAQIAAASTAGDKIQARKSRARQARQARKIKNQSNHKVETTV